MSEFEVKVIRLPAPVKHPNADSLDIFYPWGPRGYAIISKTGNYKEGDLAAYIPEDAIVPANDPRFDWLGDHRRIKAVRLRGVFSMGILHPAEPGWVEGQDVQEILGITRFQPIEERSPVDAAAPGLEVPYYDLEGYRKHNALLPEGTPVVLTEKIEGENMRAVFIPGDPGEMHVGSHGKWKKDLPEVQWWRAAKAADLPAKCQKISEKFGSPMVLYGECHGYTRGYSYGVKPGTAAFRCFDVYHTGEKRYLDYQEFKALMEEFEIPTVPVLFRGPWNPDLLSLAEGNSALDPKHIKEGIVIRWEKETHDPMIGRLCLKYPSETYLLKKGKK